jgi:hypothetical protein
MMYDWRGASIPTAYEKEQAVFAAMKRDLQARKRARWRLWLAMLVAGRKGFGRVSDAGLRSECPAPRG